LNRLTDDQSSDRIPQEAEAIEALIGFATSDPNIWVSSGVVEAEIARNPNSERRETPKLFSTSSNRPSNLMMPSLTVDVNCGVPGFPNMTQCISPAPKAAK
jgi:hypothetical protein